MSRSSKRVSDGSRQGTVMVDYDLVFGVLWDDFVDDGEGPDNWDFVVAKDLTII